MSRFSTPGRNEPCPCGSGRKYKKCCLEREPDDDRFRKLVEQALENEDWSEIDPFVDAALALFEPGCPLEYVRFDQHMLPRTEPDRQDLARLCSRGWSSWFEREVTRVLATVELREDEREALQLAVYLTRRFGALSPIVEELARLQIHEQADRVRRVAIALRSHGITREAHDIDEARTMNTWLERAHPAVLRFPEWFALRAEESPEARDALWRATIATRVCETCLEELERPTAVEPTRWGLLAALCALPAMTPELLGRALATMTTLREPTPDEAYARQSIESGIEDPAQLAEVLVRIERALDTANDFAAAALFRDAMAKLERSAKQR